jgi:hypothetical protein
MNERILTLSERKAQRRMRRKRAASQALGHYQILENGNEFLDIPIDGILPIADQQPLRSMVEGSPPLPNHPHGDSSSGSSASPLLTPAGTEPLVMEIPSSVEFDTMTTSTHISTTSLRKRLSQYSTQYVKAIARLMKAHSISDSSAATAMRPVDPPTLEIADDVTIGTATVCSTSSSDNPQTLALPVLASIFLNLDNLIKRQGFCVPGLKSHDNKTCWCHVADDVQRNIQRIWVSREGLLNHFRVENSILCDGFVDQFGNTALHMYASRYANIVIIINGLEQAPILRVQANAKNAAGQTFLHAFPGRFFRTLQEDKWNGLVGVLQKLNKFGIKYLERDEFGRSFFHLLTSGGKLLGQEELQALQFLRIHLPSSRDAFGCVPFTDQTTPIFSEEKYCIHQPTLPILPETAMPLSATSESSAVGSVNYDAACQVVNAQRQDVNIITEYPLLPSLYADSNTIPAQQPPVERSGAASSLLRPDSLTEEEQAFIYKHARLIEVARIAFDMPVIEDVEGRNGLQCLAEASLSLGISNKRKRDQSSPDHPSMRLKLRYKLVKEAVAAGVDVNNYDKKGNTVLMSFVTFMHDGEDDKMLSKLLYYLIHNGANLDWRNRQGETALHIAVRLGRKVATQVLLESGANVHARTLEGKGILNIGEMYYFQAKDNPPLYASIHACMALAVKYRAKAVPTLVDEWRGDGPVERYAYGHAYERFEWASEEKGALTALQDDE